MLNTSFSILDRLYQGSSVILKIGNDVFLLFPFITSEKHSLK